jgi:outer membrane lipase/esterase
MNVNLMAVLVLVLFTPSWAQAMTFDRIVVFGGSLSDSGNAFALLGFANRPPYDQLDSFLIPSGPYSVGGNHFSNGATWIEQLGRTLSLTGSVRPAFAGPSTEATDYAVGAARAREDGVNQKNMPVQVMAFLEDFHNIAPSEALYVIDFGGNDVRDALDEAARGGDPSTIITDALISIASNMRLLYNHGARKFLVLNVADIGNLPSILIADKLVSGTAAFATYLSAGFNLALNPTIALYFQDVSDEQIATFDVFGTVDSVIQDVKTNGEAFGFTNATQACIEPNQAPFKCDAPDQYLFWDGIHPTKAGHAFLAQVAAAVLTQP